MRLNDYYTLQKESCTEYIINKSRFIGRAKPCCSAEEAVDFIESIRASHRDATHNVYAYCVRNPVYSRYSDDGEPQGTAGVPVLEVLKNNSLTDCAVVVTRYFGGILLGAGGLVRAYSHTAKIAVDAAGISKMSLCSVCEIVADYSFYGKLPALITSFSGVIDSTEFLENIRLVFHLPAENEAAFSEALTEMSFGKLEISKMTSKYDNIL